MMTGTPHQIEWAEQIKPRVDGEFARVAQAFAETAHKQNAETRLDTLEVIAILQAKRTETMARQEAGYFIKEWQELGDQVRRMIFQDPAYAAIRERREARKSA
jgi:hypothetical protein